MLSNWGKGIPKHMDSKIRIAGNDIFNFIRKLVEFKLNIAYCVIIRGKGDTFFHSVYKAGLQCLLISGA